MPRQTKKKRTKTSRKPAAVPISSRNVEKVLIENFVSLQKIMVNLSSKFEDLTNKISKLLELFEISAKTLAEKDLHGNYAEDEKIIKKIDSLLEQNKTIARGLVLMNEMVSGGEEVAINQNQSSRESGSQVYTPKQEQTPRIIHPIKKPVIKNNANFGEYEKSIPIGNSRSEISITSEGKTGQNQDSE